MCRRKDTVNKFIKSILNCWICGKLIGGDDKVRDHGRIAGKYRGSVHYSYNINLKISKKVPVIFHKLKGYDSHLIFKELSKFNGLKITLIPNKLEKHMAFTINKNLVFIDSMQFMNFSLDKLVKSLNDKDFKYLSEEFSREQLKLVKEKGIYPDEYMSSFKWFKEDRLPVKGKFLSSLKNCGINEKEYERAVNVWKVFKIRDLGEYHDLYLKTDVLFLRDVFEKSIKACLKYYCLDPSYYFSSPGLSWDEMLKMTETKLEKINDIDMHLFIEKGMREGISYISKRYSKVDDSKSIMYWDANNLYDWSMIQHLPISDFKFLTKKEINKFDLNSISENSPIGYILEVDVEYPDELHDLHDDYLLAPEKLEISSNMLSKYCDISDKYGIKVGRVIKLVPNLRDKIKCIVHYRNLQYYL